MYRGKTFNRESVYICGDHIDGDIYPVFQPAGKRRARCRPTSAIQEKLNQRNAERKLVRLIRTNFTGYDVTLHLTYRKGEEPQDEAQAQRDVYNFLRRLRRRYAGLGAELKYISCTEYGKKNGRVHHHLVITGGMDRDEVEKLWGKGYANSKRLQLEENGAADLAVYMAKDKHFYKRWNQSRNLTVPQPVQRDGEISMEEAADAAEAIDGYYAHSWLEERYPGYELINAEWCRNNINRGIYIRFEMRKKKTRYERSRKNEIRG